MLRSALLLCAGLLAAACFACAPAGFPNAAVVPPPPPVACNVADPTSFVPSKVAVLDTRAPWNPYPGFGDPPILPGAVPTANTADDLTQAFTIAPPFFRQHLCDLEGVFVDPTICSGLDGCSGRSWGYRDPSTGKMYIGASANILWPGGGHAPVLTQYETNLVNWQLSRLDGGLTWGSGGTPYFSSRYGISDPANTSAMTVLAALAHEVGHVRWYQVNVATPGKFDYDFTKYLMPCRSDGTTRFFDEAWDYPDTTALQPPQWRGAVDVVPPSVSHVVPPQNNELQHPGTVAALRVTLASLHGRRHPWASLLASLSPDHDFVETYVFNVLTYNSVLNDPTNHPYVRSLQLTIPVSGAARDIPYDYFKHAGDKAKFVRKVACVAWLNDNLPLRPGLQAR